MSPLMMTYRGCFGHSAEYGQRCVCVCVWGLNNRKYPVKFGMNTLFFFFFGYADVCTAVIHRGTNILMCWLSHIYNTKK